MMTHLVTYLRHAQTLLDQTRCFDFLAPLLLRLYLAPVFWVAGTNKLSSMDSVITWFGNPEWGLGLPFPGIMAWLATLSEVFGAALLVLGLATRWICIPLMITMLVATFTVHWQNGWQAIASQTSAFPSANIDAAMQRLTHANDILREHGDYEWLIETGSFVILNNGIEWTATYFIMLLALFFIGSGRYLSIDYWLRYYCMKP